MASRNAAAAHEELHLFDPRTDRPLKILTRDHWRCTHNTPRWYESARCADDCSVALGIPLLDLGRTSKACIELFGTGRICSAGSQAYAMHTIWFMPPLTVTDEEIELALTALGKALADLDA